MPYSLGKLWIIFNKKSYYVPSAAPSVRHKTPIVPAAPGRAAASPPAGGRALVPEGTLFPLLGPYTLGSPSRLGRGRSVSPTRTGSDQACPAAPGATPRPL